VNAQYGYGYAVPFLCAYLIWQSAKREAQGAGREAQGASRLPLGAWGLALGAFLYLPIRLVQEANPEWRLVSWALALVVIGITLSAWRKARGARREAHGARRLAPAAPPVFALLFFLVAVPWPTLLEWPLIQTLTRVNTGTTVEVLGLLGVPAIQHGNVIEVGAGAVGIDEACSGIRSFQATLMISLFFGELYRLSLLRRAGLCVAGFFLSFVFNVIRTTLLTWVAARHGMAAIANWHDPAGVIILLACFVSLWLIARSAKREAPSAEREAPSGKRLAPRALRLAPCALAAWLLAVELGTEFWYRSHESHLPQAPVWHVALPRENPTFRDLPFHEKAKQFLRFDEGLNGAWEDDQHRRWQATFLRWMPGRIAVDLATGHTPEACLPAGGRTLISQSGLHTVPVKGLQLPFRSYLATPDRNADFQLGPAPAAAPLHVFYCLWEDRAGEQSFGAKSLTYANRLAPVLAGRRNSGQRSLEVAVWGIDSSAEAEAALERELEKLIQAGSGKR